MKKTVVIIRDVIFVMAAAVITAAGLCTVLQIKPAVVISGSMEPAIHIGSLVLIEKNTTEPAIGDIIAFEKGGAFITHRVAETRNEGYITKGDANRTFDPGIVTEDMIVGTTVLTVPYAGYAVKALSTGRGIIICVTVYASIMLASCMMSAKSEKG